MAAYIAETDCEHHADPSWRERRCCVIPPGPHRALDDRDIKVCCNPTADRDHLKSARGGQIPPPYFWPADEGVAFKSMDHQRTVGTLRGRKADSKTRQFTKCTSSSAKICLTRKS